MIIIPKALQTIFALPKEERAAFRALAESRHITPLNVAINVNGNTAEIDVDGVIGEDWWDWEDPKKNTAETIRKQLRDLDVTNITVNVQSPGGDVGDGVAIYDLLAEHKADVTTKIYGLTASAATIVSQAGTRRLMSSASRMLIHRAWTIALGNRNNFAAALEALDSMDDMISGVYATNGTKDKEEYLAEMNQNNGDGRWLSADQALELGLIDEIFESKAKPESDSEANNSVTPPIVAPTQNQPHANANTDARAREIEILKIKGKHL